MTLPWRSPLDVDTDRQQQRLGALRDWFEHAEPLRLSLAGLRFWLDASIDAVPPSRVTAELRSDVDRLHEHGLITGNGAVPDDMRPVVQAVRAPLCIVDVEAEIGQTARHLRAWIGESCAVVLMTDPPWAGVEPTAAAYAARDDPPSPERQLVILPYDGPLLMAARWAMVTPRRVLATAELEVRSGLFHQRLADHTIPLPEGADPRLAEIWAEPMFTWGIWIDRVGQTSDIGDAVLVLDAGRAGHRQVVVNGETLALYPLPSHALWTGMVEMLDHALS